MNWFVLVVMMGMGADGMQDTYVYTDPLPSLEACQQHVAERAQQLRWEMFIEFEGKSIERVFCINEDKLKLFFDIMSGEKGA